MKLLLTSEGFANKSIKKAFQKLLEKPVSKAQLAFIPTASNVEAGDKWWIIKDLNTLKEMGFKEIDIVDISAISTKMMQDRLKSADIFFVEGGNTFHLMYWIKKSGLDKTLPELLRTRIWVGASAGSIAAGKKLATSAERFYDEGIGEYKGSDGLGFVDFSIRPHLNNPIFPDVTPENVKKVAENLKTPLYAIDDETAILVDEDKVEVISEGKWKVFE